MDPEQAIADFKARMANYEKAYEPVSEEIEGYDIRYILIRNIAILVLVILFIMFFYFFF